MPEPVYLRHPPERDWPCENCGLAWNSHFAKPPALGHEQGQTSAALACPQRAHSREKTTYVRASERWMDIRSVWNHDPDEGYCWACPDCDSWSTLGGNAGYHATLKDHGVPILTEVPADTDGDTALHFDGVTYRLHVRKGDEGTEITLTSTNPPQGLDRELYRFAGRLPKR